MSQFSILQMANLLASAFDERHLALKNFLEGSSIQEGQDTVAFIAKCDELILQLLQSLTDYPVEKWCNFCEAIEPNAVFIAAASYCKGFNAGILDRLLEQFPQRVTPFSDLHGSSYFFNRDILSKQIANNGTETQFFHRLFHSDIRHQSLCFLLLAANSIRINIEDSKLKEIHPDIATIVAYNWVCCGLSAGKENILLHWLDKAGDAPILQFWAAFALVLRHPFFHKQVDKCVARATDKISRNFAFSLQQAIQDGPLREQESLELAEIISLGSGKPPLHHAVRLVMWLPNQAPLIEIGCCTPYREQRLTQLITHIKQAIANNDVFLPEHYHVEKPKSKTVRHLVHSAEALIAQGQVRGWTQQKIDITLRQTTFPLLEEGLSVQFYPQNNASIVISNDTRSIVNFGRANYAYPAKTPIAMATQKFPSLPIPIYEGCEWIWLPLSREPIEVWRPVEARRMQDNIFCIMPQQNQTADEYWLYPPTAYVICALKSFIGGSFLAAVKPGPAHM